MKDLIAPSREIQQHIFFFFFVIIHKKCLLKKKEKVKTVRGYINKEHIRIIFLVLGRNYLFIGICRTYLEI